MRDDRGLPGHRPPDDGGPLDDEDPLGMEEIQDTLEEEAHQAHQDLLDP